MFHRYSLITFVVIICYFKVQCQLYEGSPCTGNDKNVKGTCVPVNQCMSAAHDIKQRLFPQLCSFKDGMPIVCCSDCKLINDNSNVLVDKMGWFYFKTGQKARDKCLEYMMNLNYPCRPVRGHRRYTDKKNSCYGFRHYNSTFVIGGVSKKREEFPHMALIGYGLDLASAQWLCSGSVISERFILTAGSCMNHPDFGPVTYVALGISKRSEPLKTWQTYRVNKIIAHPEYHTPVKYNDIALLEVDRTLKFNRQVLPACLHTGDHNEENARATGWGALGPNKDVEDTLQVVTLEQYPKPTCAQFYPPTRLLANGYNDTTQSCYGDRNKMNITCKGDSGSPLQVRYQNMICMSVIIGVTSIGNTCGTQGNAGMYSKVSHYVPWIESIVWP